MIFLSFFHGSLTTELVAVMEGDGSGLRERNEAEFTVKVEGRGFTKCTFTTVPVRLLPCSGRACRKTIPEGYRFCWQWKAKNMIVSGFVSQDSSKHALVEMEGKIIISGVMGVPTAVKVSGTGPSTVLTSLLEQLRGAGLCLSANTKINAWQAIGLDKTSQCMAFISNNQATNKVIACWSVAFLVVLRGL